MNPEAQNLPRLAYLKPCKTRIVFLDMRKDDFWVWVSGYVKIRGPNLWANPPSMRKHSNLSPPRGGAVSSGGSGSSSEIRFLSRPKVWLQLFAVYICHPPVDHLAEAVLPIFFIFAWLSTLRSSHWFSKRMANDFLGSSSGETPHILTFWPFLKDSAQNRTFIGIPVLLEDIESFASTKAYHRQINSESSNW